MMKAALLLCCCLVAFSAVNGFQQPPVRQHTSKLKKTHHSTTNPSLPSVSSAPKSRIVWGQQQQQQQQQPFSGVSFTSLYSTTPQRSSSSSSPELDVDAITKYLLAIAVQMGGFFCLLKAFDQASATLNVEAFPIFWVNVLFFYACSLKSRVLNPLSNDRPSSNRPLQEDVIRPSWFPPGVLFPIMWILIIGPLRAYSSALVVDASAGEYANIATLCFLLHLSIGDVWNTVNNVEQRLGAAASGVVLVVSSAALAAYQYYQVDALSGQLLALTLVWLGTAAVLVNTIWRINPDPNSGEVDVWYPAKGNVETTFAWFSSSSNSREE